MYEACFITWWGRKDMTLLTYVENVRIRLHKSDLFFCIYRTKTNKTKYCVLEHGSLLGYAPALIKFTEDSSYPYIVKFYGKIYEVHKSGRCKELWNDYLHT